MASIIVLGTAATGVYFARSDLPVAGKVIIWSVVLLFLLLPVCLVGFTVKYLTSVRVIHLGPHGAYAQLFLRFTPLKPLTESRNKMTVEHIPAKISRPYLPPAPPEPLLPSTSPEEDSPQSYEPEIPTPETNIIPLYPEDELTKAKELFFKQGIQTPRKLATALEIDQGRAKVLIAQIVEGVKENV